MNELGADATFTSYMMDGGGKMGKISMFTTCECSQVVTTIIYCIYI